ncbi:MAG: hypothetical protein CMD82_00535 [Gammaproteobacteria bacterium]|nr:hypothetical protein [Gammaproteobacteria bacterium]|tara:strand:- start:5140 stop:5607 length:468 start_codon:yes stop_codon:yes gene_type:complete
MNEIETELMETINDLVLKEDIEILNIEIIGSRNANRAEIVIDSQKGITIDDCANVSNIIRDVIRFDDKFSDISEMSIEVSSPGINRRLYNLKDYENFIGEKTLIKLKRAVNGKRTIKGRISKVEESLIELEVHGEVISILFENIKKANLQREIKV